MLANESVFITDMKSRIKLCLQNHIKLSDVKCSFDDLLQLANSLCDTLCCDVDAAVADSAKYVVSDDFVRIVCDLVINSATLDYC